LEGKAGACRGYQDPASLSLKDPIAVPVVPLSKPCLLPSRRFSFRIDGGKVFLSDIIHCAVHRTDREFTKVEQQIAAERRFIRKIEPRRHLVVGERERHAVMM
jgi:hypothetical protein